MTLKLGVGSDAGSGDITIFLGSHNNWTEDNLSAVSAPLVGQSLATSTVALAVGYIFNYDVSSATLSDGKVTFVVTMAFDKFINQTIPHI